MKTKIALAGIVLLLSSTFLSAVQQFTRPDGTMGYTLKIDETGNLKVTGSTNTAIGSVVSSSVTTKVSIYKGETITIVDTNYESKISTQAIGRLLTADTTLSPDFSITSYSFKVKGTTGGTWNTNLGSGTGYFMDDMDIREAIALPKASITFNFSIPNGTTVYYIINGIK